MLERATEVEFERGTWDKGFNVNGNESSRHGIKNVCHRPYKMKTIHYQPPVQIIDFSFPSNLAVVCSINFTSIHCVLLINTNDWLIQFTWSYPRKRIIFLWSLIDSPYLILLYFCFMCPSRGYRKSQWYGDRRQDDQKLDSWPIVCLTWIIRWSLTL